MLCRICSISLAFLLFTTLTACGVSVSDGQTAAVETEYAIQTAVAETFAAEPTVTPKPTTTPIPTSTPTAIPVFRDDFSGDLQPGWSWIRENDTLWSLTSDGFLRIVLQGGNYPRNLLVREVASDNFQIMTHLLFKPTSNYQFAALFVYQDDKTNTAFGRAFCDTQNGCVGNGIYFDALQSGQSIGTNYATDIQDEDEIYLRLDKVGSVFTGYYSEDGENWYAVGDHEVNMVDPKVGLHAGNSYVVGMTALFDYFTVKEMP